jgi:hypothetical protein
MATMQVAQAGSDGQIIEARRLLANLRRKLNRILAEDDPYGDDRLARGVMHVVAWAASVGLLTTLAREEESA